MARTVFAVLMRPFTSERVYRLEVEGSSNWDSGPMLSSEYLLNGRGFDSLTSPAIDGSQELACYMISYLSVYGIYIYRSYIISCILGYPNSCAQSQFGCGYWEVYLHVDIKLETEGICLVSWYKCQGIYYPPEASSMKYCWLGLFRKEYFRLVTK